MPKNNNLPPIKFPMEVKFYKEPKTEFVNNLKSIGVTLQNAPTMDDLRSYLPFFATATWEDIPVNPNMTKLERDKIIYMIFREKILPPSMETIKLTFLLEGISGQDVTHILRYRSATFSAECSADKFWNDKRITVPTSIENSPEFYRRYEKLHLDMKQLYCDMLNSRDISLLDARYVLTRACETYYWMSMSLRDALHFVRQRIDKQIQPESDNVIAYLMWQQLIKQYPLLVDLIDIHAPAQFYVDTARTGRCTNLFVPDADSDIYEWNEEDYLYGRTRSEVNGTDPFKSKKNRPFYDILKNTENHINLVKVKNKLNYGEEFFKI
jgi:hypothetical protein